MLRNFYSDITEVMVHPRNVALKLYQEGVVAEPVLDEVNVPARSSLEKKDAIMRAVSAAVRGDSKKLLVFIAVMQMFAESAPVANRMKNVLREHWSCEPPKRCYIFRFLSGLTSCFFAALQQERPSATQGLRCLVFV